MTSGSGRKRRAGASLALIVALVALAPGCGSSSPGFDASGLGSMLGQASGPEAKSAVVGPNVGTGVGYIIGDEADRAKAARLDAAEHYEVGRIGATRWEVLDITPGDRVPEFKKKIVYFRQDGRVETTTTFADGRTEVTDESYRVVGGTMIVSRKGYMINAKYWLTGQQMILDGDDFRVVLLRLPS